jgi:DNA (cytosine-5)-methyltransferase 1
MKFEFPRPSFSAPEKLNENARLPFDSLSPYRTAWDALADLSDPVDERLEVGGKWGDLLRSIPEGQNYLWHTDRLGGMNLFGWRTRYWSFLLKLAKARPSWAIQAQPGSAIGPFHWANRRLSVREMCRLQTFPDDYKIQGGRSSSQRQLGNAVPSLLAEILGIEIRRQLLGSRLAGRKLKLLPPDRSPAPPPERVRAVCKKYHCHEGAHDPHPGNGKGRRAQQREKQGSVSKQSQADT